MNWITWVNAISGIWSTTLLRGSLEVLLLLAIVILLQKSLRDRISTPLSYALFVLVLLRVALPLPLHVPPAWMDWWPAAIVEQRVVATSESVTRWARSTPHAVHAGLAAEVSDVAPNSTTNRRHAVVTESLAMPEHLSGASILMLVWATIVCGLSGLGLFRAIRLHRLIRNARPLDWAELPVEIAELARRAGLRSSPKLIEAAWLRSPAVWGLWRPVVLIPSDLATVLSCSELKWVLLHEFAHIRRHDNCVVLFQRLVQIVYFFHPAVWLANHFIDLTREFACDDQALATSGGERTTGARAFLTLVERSCLPPMFPLPLNGLSMSPTTTRSRLMRMLNQDRPLQTHLSAGAWVVLMLLAAVTLPRLLATEPANHTAPNSFVALQQTPTPKLAEVAGVVVDRQGRPVAGVRVTATEVHHEVDFRDGELIDNGLRQRPFVTTDAQGRYRFATQNKEYGVFAAHDQGYARKSARELAESTQLTLEPWARIEGIVKTGEQPQAQTKVRVTLDATDHHSMFYDVFDFHAVSDAKGRFLIERVPAGIAAAVTVPPANSVARALPSADFAEAAALQSANVRVSAGATATVVVGGSGITVTGRLNQPSGEPRVVVGGRLVQPSPLDAVPIPAEIERADADRRFHYFFERYRSAAGQESRLTHRAFAVQLVEGGRFQVQDVPAGKYRLEFWANATSQAPIAQQDVTVTPADVTRGAARELVVVTLP